MYFVRLYLMPTATTRTIFGVRFRWFRPLRYSYDRRAAKVRVPLTSTTGLATRGGICLHQDCEHPPKTRVRQIAQHERGVSGLSGMPKVTTRRLRE